ncbi:MAG: FAD-binding oxidoreductase [Acidiferrobacteraceae bacterium]
MTQQSRNETDAIAAFTQALGADRVQLEHSSRLLYASDDGPGCCEPMAVLFPTSHEQVCAVVAIANRFHIPLIARGAGSGNVGGALPVPGSAVVSLECMRRVLDFSPGDRVVSVEAGVVTADIDHLARGAGLFYPPNPGSSAYCRIGGNVATNAAGPRSLKYGVTRDYVLGLRVVTGDARSLVLGCRTSKGVVGYDLTRLIVGSEGTLAICTEVTLRLVPLPAASATLRAAYSDPIAACRDVLKIMRAPVTPAAVEFLDDRSIALMDPPDRAVLPKGTAALLLIELDGDAGDIDRSVSLLRPALVGPALIDFAVEHTREGSARLWSARAALSRALKRSRRRKLNEDVVVPVNRLPDLLTEISTLGAHHALPIVTFGHAGNGNLHVNIMVDPASQAEAVRAHACLRGLFLAVVALGGTLSGEHGIGTEKVSFVSLEQSPQLIDLEWRIKSVLDPNGILNPGKAIPARHGTYHAKGVVGAAHLT